MQDTLELHSKLFILIREIGQKIDLVLSPYAEGADITTLQLKMILALAVAREELPMGEIGQIAGIAGGNISNTCKKMEQKGFVTRTRGTEDERVVFVKLTDKGRELCEKVRVEFINRFGDTEEKLSKVQVVYDNLSDLEKLLDKYY